MTPSEVHACELIMIACTCCISYSPLHRLLPVLHVFATLASFTYSVAYRRVTGWMNTHSAMGPCKRQLSLAPAENTQEAVHQTAKLNWSFSGARYARSSRA